MIHDILMYLAYGLGGFFVWLIVWVVLNAVVSKVKDSEAREVAGVLVFIWPVILLLCAGTTKLIFYVGSLL